jgi:hypothetical protein
MIQSRRCANLLLRNHQKNRNFIKSFNTTSGKRATLEKPVLCKSLTSTNQNCTDVATKQDYTTALSNLTKDQAVDLVFRLNETEKQILLSTLKEFQSNQTKSEYEGGRLNKIN